MSFSRPRVHNTLVSNLRSYCHPDYKAEDEPDYLFPMAAKDFCVDVRGQAVIGACLVAKERVAPFARRNRNIPSAFSTRRVCVCVCVCVGVCVCVCPSQPIADQSTFPPPCRSIVFQMLPTRRRWTGLPTNEGIVDLPVSGPH